MAEEFLDRPYVVACLEQMRGERVTKGVTAYRFVRPARRAAAARPVELETRVGVAWHADDGSTIVRTATAHTPTVLENVTVAGDIAFAAARRRAAIRGPRTTTNTTPGVV